MNTTPFQIACEKLRALGLELQQVPGLYLVNFRNGSATTEYQTDDLLDALEQGRVMASNPPPSPEPPPGPTRARSRRRAFMLAHNNRVEDRRRKRRAKGKG